MNEVLESIKTLENEIGIPNGYLYGIEKEDDWSFIIKASAIMEAVITHLLIAHFNDVKLNENISFMNMGGKTGKISFAESLKIGSKENLKFIGKLTELRNKLVHNISNINFKLEDYVNDMSKQQLNEFTNWMSMGEKEDVRVGKRKIPRIKFIKDNPKVSLFLNLIIVLESLSLTNDLLKSKKTLQEKQIRMSELALELLKKQ